MSMCSYSNTDVSFFFMVYYRIITTVERDTGKYHEFIAGIVYECAARVNNAGGNERVMFPTYRVLQW